MGDIMPTSTPLKVLLSKENSGTVIMTPARMMRASITLRVFGFSSFRAGSINVTKRGKVEKVIVPMATVESWMDSNMVHQCMAITAPDMIRSRRSFLLSTLNDRPVRSIKIPSDSLVGDW